MQRVPIHPQSLAPPPPLPRPLSRLCVVVVVNFLCIHTRPPATKLSSFEMSRGPNQDPITHPWPLERLGPKINSWRLIPGVWGPLEPPYDGPPVLMQPSRKILAMSMPVTCLICSAVPRVTPSSTAHGIMESRRACLPLKLYFTEMNVFECKMRVIFARALL